MVGLSNHFYESTIFSTSIYAINSLENRVCFIISSALFSNIFANSRKIQGTFGQKLQMKIGLCVMFITFVGLSFIQSPLVTVYNGEFIASIWGGVSSQLIINQL